ncbi:MAG: hypothetical protein LC624_07360 [Halobacteriales archaeon]|nr:hypothetical protein [Halobacteriales archaeon]
MQQGRDLVEREVEAAPFRAAVHLEAHVALARRLHGLEGEPFLDEREELHGLAVHARAVGSMP